MISPAHNRALLPLAQMILLVFLVQFVAATEFRHDIYGRYGTISSPNFPMKYPLNTTVIWYIMVDSPKTIQLNFTAFSLEKNKKCIYDHVFIEETKLGAASITRKYCGHRKPPNYKSLSNRIRVVFESDGLSNVDYGFKATWVEVGGASPGILPTNSIIKPTKSCLPTTITVVEPCKVPMPNAVTVTVTEKPPHCICATKTLTKTVTTTKTVTPSSSIHVSSTKSYDSSQVKSTVRSSRDNDISNSVEESDGCKALPPSSLIDAEKVAAERESSKSLVVSLGVVLAALFITNIFLLVLLCKRERGNNAMSFYSLRRLLNSKRRPASNTPDIYYSSYTRPTLRMVNGEIVIMPQGPPTLTTDSDATSSVLLETYKRDKRVKQPTNIDDIEESTEMPFHITPQDQVVSTLASGGTDENTLPSTRSEVLSDSEPPEYC